MAGQVLEDTAVPALLDITSHGSQEPSHPPNGKPKRSRMSNVMGANIHPQRTSSLSGPITKQPAAPRPQSEHKPQDDEPMTTVRPTSSAGTEAAAPIGIPGQAELATYRAELVLLRRKMLEQLARQRGWYTGWSFVNHTKQAPLQHVSLEDTSRDSALASSEHSETASRSLGPSLEKSLKSEADFRLAYEQVTDTAIRHYHAATQNKSTDALLGDLAILKFQQGEYGTAASYFQHILPLLATDNWDMMEFEALRAYSDCLKHLDRCEDYVRNGLSLLSKAFGRKTESKTPRFLFQQEEDEGITNPKLLVDVITASASLQKELDHPLKNIFAEVHLNQQVRHEDDSDAFVLSLQLKHILGDAVELDQISAHLVRHQDPNQEIWLTSRGSVTLLPGMNTVELVGGTVAFGAFLIDQVVLNAGKLRFIEELRPPPKPTPLGFTEIEPPTVTVREPEKAPSFVFLYPAERAFGAEIRRSRSIHIDRPRHLDVLLNAGQNEISDIDIRLKPTSAGLRLHLADTTSSGIELNKSEANKPGQVLLQGLGSCAKASVKVPYTVEQSSKEITARLEIRYTTASGTFTFLHSARLAHELPLDVDVNDIFQLDALYSNFTVRTTNRVPFSVVGAKLDESPIYRVTAPPALPVPLTVFEAQPMNLVYKITKKPSASNNTLKKDAALALHVSYQPIDEILLQNIRKMFVEEVGRSDLGDLRHLLVPLLLERCRQFIRGKDLEIEAILEESKIPDFDTVGWQEVIATLPSQRRVGVEAWLKQWHVAHSRVTTVCDQQDDLVTQEIIISVDVPNVDVVFSASLDLSVSPGEAGSEPQILVLGQPVQATVRIKSTAEWSSMRTFPNVPTFKIHGDGEESTSFVCDVSTDNDTWVIGGQRRCHFIPQDGQEHLIQVILIPLKLGTHALPFIEVQKESLDSEATTQSLTDGSVSCHTHYESSGKVVQVIRDVRTSRVHIAE